MASSAWGRGQGHRCQKACGAGRAECCTAASLVKVWPPQVHLSRTPSLQEVEVYTLNKVMRRNFHGKLSGPELQAVAPVPPKAVTTRPSYGSCRVECLLKHVLFRVS